MASKLRLNVVCSSRDKRFLVLVEEDWNLEDVKECVELVFQNLYSSEKALQVSKLQNEFHFDLPLHYIVKDTLSDTGLVFAVEEQTLLNSNQQSSSTDVSQNSSNDILKIKRKKKGKSPKKSSKRKASTSSDGDSTSNNTVTSTTGSPISHVEDINNLMPQVVERDPREDTDVDIETLED